MVREVVCERAPVVGCTRLDLVTTRAHSVAPDGQLVAFRRLPWPPVRTR